MKNVIKFFISLCLLMSSVTFAQSADHDRLKALLQKEVESLQSGKGPLQSAEENEKINLTNKVGAMEAHRLMTEAVLAVTKSPQLKEVNEFSKQIVNSTPPQNHVEKPKEDPNKPQSVKDVVANADLESEDEDAEAKPALKAASMNSPNFSEEEKVRC